MTDKLKMRYDFIEDPSHGWVKVPHEDILYLGIQNSITPYSYIDDKFCYLEEDCDAGTFCDAIRKLDLIKMPLFNSKHVERTAIRQKQAYSVELFNRYLIAIENRKAVQS